MPEADPTIHPRENAPLERPRVALVGCGTVGELHRDRLLQESVEITAVCDPDADALARMAHSLPRRPRLFRSEQDLLEAGIVDAVVLCTPHARHAGQIRAALEAGVHVLCEKPFVTRLEEASELVRMARERNLALFVAYTRRSRGHARFLLDAAGRVGPLTDVVITRAQPWLQAHQRTWRLHEGEGGGFLLDAGASMIDLLLRFAASPVTDVDALMWRPASVDVDVRSSIRLAFSSGLRADLTFLGDAAATVENIQLFGERGTAGWSLRGADGPYDLYVSVVDPDKGDTLLENGDAALYRTMPPDAAFVAALRSGRSFGADTAQDLYDAASAVPVVGLVERAYHEAVWR